MHHFAKKYTLTEQHWKGFRNKTHFYEFRFSPTQWTLSLGVKLYKRVKLNENIWEYCLFYWEAGCQNQNITAVHKSQVKPLRWFLSYDILVFHWCCDSICSIYWQLSHLFLSFQKKICLCVCAEPLSRKIKFRYI